MDRASLFIRYSVVTALAIIGVISMTTVIATYVGVTVNPIVGLISTIIPATDAGWAYDKREGEKLPWRDISWFAVAFVALNMVVGGAILVTLLLVVGGLGQFAGDLGFIFGMLGVAKSGVVIVVIFTAYWLLNAVFFWLGTKRLQRGG